MKRIAITGSSGLIGTALRRSLALEAQVLRLVRDDTVAADPGEILVLWDPMTGATKHPERLEGLDAVVHLAGDNLSEGRWTAEKKRRIAESRSNPTQALAKLLAGLKQKPRVLISASAVGIYGDRGEESLTELAAAGTGFLPVSVTAWEAAAEPARTAGIRVVHPRFGVVLSPEGGALKKMLPAFRAGLGGRLGSGQQWISWVSLRDAVSAIEFLIEHEAIHGAANVVSPNPVRNVEFTRELGHVVRRPAVLAVPRFVLRAAFGEMAEATILTSVRGVPEVLLGEGFRFRDVEVGVAFEAMFQMAR